MPTPARAICCGLVGSESERLIAAFLFPIAVGVNVTWTTQCAAGASVAGQLFVCAKSPLLIVMELMERGPVPLLVSVTFCGALLVPTFCPRKVKLEGERLAPGVVPVPLRLTECGLPAPLSFTVTEPLRDPVVEGVKVTLMLQIALTASEAGQLLV